MPRYSMGEMCGQINKTSLMPKIYVLINENSDSSLRTCLVSAACVAKLQKYCVGTWTMCAQLIPKPPIQMFPNIN